AEDRSAGQGELLDPALFGPGPVGGAQVAEDVGVADADQLGVVAAGLGIAELDEVAPVATDGHFLSGERNGLAASISVDDPQDGHDGRVGITGPWPVGSFPARPRLCRGVACARGQWPVICGDVAWGRSSDVEWRSPGTPGSSLAVRSSAGQEPGVPGRRSWVPGFCPWMG